MKVKIVVLAIVGLGAPGVFGSTIGAQQPAPSRSVLDGVYTEDQAKRGQALYSQECSTCHGQGLGGAEMAPPLAGPAFAADWNGLSIGDLVDRIRVSMPVNDPGKLSRQQCADIVSFVLKSGQFPAGKAELPSETEALKDIRFEALKQ